MSEPRYVNPQIIEVINQVQDATMGPQVVKTSGAGKAYQSVAQSAALAVQDATDMLRSAAALSLTATGVAFAQMLASPNAGVDTKAYETTIDKARASMQGATDDFSAIGSAATRVLSGFPAG